MLGFGALGQFALGEGPEPQPTFRGASAFSEPLRKAGLTAAVIATTFVGFVPPPQAQAAPVFAQFSQPQRMPVQQASWQFVPPPQAQASPIFNQYSQPQRKSVQQASWQFIPAPARTQTAIFSAFSQPQFPRINLPDEQPSALFEVAPPPVIRVVFSQFAQPQFSRSTLPDEQPSAFLFEIRPPTLPPFTGFARFDEPLRPKSQIFLYGSFQLTGTIYPVPDTHDLVFMGDQFRKKKHKDPLDLELERKAKLRADLELAVYGPEVTYQPPIGGQIPAMLRQPPNVEELTRAIMLANEAHAKAQKAALDQDDEDVIELILRDL